MCLALVAASLHSDQFQQLVPADLAKRNAAIEKHAKDVKTLVDLIVKAINAKKTQSRIHTQKTLVVERATNKGTSLVEGIARPNAPNRLRAVNDYLTRTSDGSDGPDGPNTAGRNKCNSCQFVEEVTLCSELLGINEPYEQAARPAAETACTVLFGSFAITFSFNNLSFLCFFTTAFPFAAEQLTSAQSLSDSTQLLLSTAQLNFNRSLTKWTAFAGTCCGPYPIGNYLLPLLCVLLLNLIDSSSILAPFDRSWATVPPAHYVVQSCQLLKWTHGELQAVEHSKKTSPQDTV
ncbi:hypothetical protein B0H14DRAFT_3132010 [Mycena olivaceomarginata]|nr:hypothetical protein B0H14DRAFT_3132010 [Mycena olivaceomarginata]